jgi:hypothetical protein
MANKDDTIAELRQLVEKLTKRIEELELQLAKAQKDSSNSSKSPSSDIVKPPKKKADRRKKAKRGGQKGHTSIYVRAKRRADQQSLRTASTPLRDRSPHHARHS